MDQNLIKSLENIIAETLDEIEDLKKSDRFSAASITLDGPGGDMSGHPANGHIAKGEDDKEDDKVEKAEDCDSDDKDSKDKDDKKKDKDDDDMEKAEGKNSEADPNAGHHQADGGASGPEVKKAEGKNREADPNGGHHQADGSLKKSLQDHEDLMKSYVDTQIAGISEQLAKMNQLISDIADTPVVSNSSSYKDVVPLAKSDESVESLSKSQVIDKLYELKKSDVSSVDSKDFFSIELNGSQENLSRISRKYNLS